MTVGAMPGQPGGGYPPGPLNLAAQRQRIAADIAQRQTGIVRAEADIGQAVIDGLGRPGAQPPAPQLQEELARISAARGYIDQLAQQLHAIDAEQAATVGAQPDASLVCPACRSAIVGGQRFCTVCGEKLVDRGAVPAHRLAHALPTDTAATSCARCGRPTEAGLSYCPLCGWQVGRSRVAWYRAKWLRVLLGGVAIYFFCRISLPHLGYSGALVVADLIVGAAIVPVSFVLWLHERGTRDQTSPSVLVTAFLFGAVLAIPLVLVISQPFDWKGAAGDFRTGFFEEGAKLAVALLFLRRRDLLAPDKGLVIGAAVGMGFASLETMQYGINELLTVFVEVIRHQVPGDALHYPVKFMNQTLQVRAFLAPMGHGTWTALTAGVVWYSRARGRSAFGLATWLTYVTMALAHAFFDMTIGSSVGQVSILGNKLGIFGLLIGATGFAVLMTIVLLARRGRDPLGRFVDVTARLSNQAFGNTALQYGMPAWQGPPGTPPGWSQQPPQGPPTGWVPPPGAPMPPGPPPPGGPPPRHGPPR